MSGKPQSFNGCPICINIFLCAQKILKILTEWSLNWISGLVERD